jgi:hypothetical protein
VAGGGLATGFLPLASLFRRLPACPRSEPFRPGMGPRADRFLSSDETVDRHSHFFTRWDSLGIDRAGFRANQGRKTFRGGIFDRGGQRREKRLKNVASSVVKSFG